MPSNKNNIDKTGKSKKLANRHTDFSKILQSAKKSKVKPIDREMVFVTYLLEQKFNGYAKSGSAIFPKQKPES